MPGSQSDVEMELWWLVGLPTGTIPLVQWKLCGEQCILAPTLRAHFGIRSAFCQCGSQWRCLSAGRANSIEAGPVVPPAPLLLSRSVGQLAGATATVPQSAHAEVNEPDAELK